MLLEQFPLQVSGQAFRDQNNRVPVLAGVAVVLLAKDLQREY